MALSAGDLVTPNTVVGGVLNGASWLAQPPIIGILSGTDPFGVLWDNGFFDLLVPGASLLPISAPAATTLAGQVVRSKLNNQSGEFIGTVVFLGGIDLGQGAADFAVVKSLGPGVFYWEALVSDLEVVDGR